MAEAEPAGRLAIVDVAVSNVKCHVCGLDGLHVFPDFERLPRVTSDCRAWPAGGRLGVCGNCGTLQHLVDERWRTEAAEIYNQYDVYHQAAGEEQKTFAADGAAGPRSARLVRHLIETETLPPTGCLLDFGCGNGAFLRAFATHAPRWTLIGADIGERHRQAVEEVAGAGRYVNLMDTRHPGTGFDLITMSHCLEHLDNPLPLLARMREWLAPRGRLLIQVPHVLESPFDLVVADHCSHFTTTTLGELLDAAGYDVMRVETAVVQKEITALARPAARNPRPPSPRPGREVACSATFVSAALRWLETVVVERGRLASHGRFGIFGTSIAGIWLYGAAREQVDFFVDEDPNRVGRHIDRIPILHPAQVDAGASVLLAMPCAIAERLYQRLGSGPGRYHLPPSWPES